MNPRVRVQAPAEASAAKLPSMLGARIRHARRVARLTLTQLAEKAGCSESLISKIENAQASPSLAMLHRIAAALDSNIASLTAEGTPAASPVMRQGQRPLVGAGSIVLERLVMAERGGLLQANIHIVEPGGASDGQIVHAGEEVGYVLDGHIELTLGDVCYALKAGDAFTFASLQPHGYRNLGTSVARILWVNTPATF